MERREFLKAGAAAGATLAAAGCATGTGKAPTAAKVPPPTPEQIDYLTTGMDRVLASLDRTDLVHEIVPADLPLPFDDKKEMAPIESLLDKGIRSLYVSGIFLDQPEAVREHPELQKRVIDNLPVMDEAIRESTAMLASLSQVDGKQFQQTLDEHPEIGMRVAEALDRRAGDLGISPKRRMQLRLAATQVTARLRHQHPAVLAEEYLVKTNKAYVRHGATELSRKLAASAGAQMFWAPVVASETGGSETIFRPSGAYEPPGTKTAARGTPEAAPPATAQPPVPRRPGERAATAAAWMFGIGVVAVLGGALIVKAGAFAGVFAITAGVILFLVALITFIVAGIQRAVAGKR